MLTTTPNLEFNIIIVPDEESGQFSAFFAQFPQAIAVGDTEDEAVTKLIPLVTRMLSDTKEEMISSVRQKYKYSEKQVSAHFVI